MREVLGLFLRGFRVHSLISSDLLPQKHPQGLIAGSPLRIENIKVKTQDDVKTLSLTYTVTCLGSICRFEIQITRPKNVTQSLWGYLQAGAYEASQLWLLCKCIT